MAFSPDDKRLASASCDKTVRLWSVKTGAVCGVLQDHTDSVNSVAFSPDGRFIARTSADGTVKLWNRPQGTACKSFRGGEKWVAFTPNNQILSSTSTNGTICLWNVNTSVACDTGIGRRDGGNKYVLGISFRIESVIHGVYQGSDYVSGWPISCLCSWSSNG